MLVGLLRGPQGIGRRGWRLGRRGGHGCDLAVAVGLALRGQGSFNIAVLLRGAPRWLCLGLVRAFAKSFGVARTAEKRAIWKDFTGAAGDPSVRSTSSNSSAGMHANPNFEGASASSGSSATSGPCLVTAETCSCDAILDTACTSGPDTGVEAPGKRKDSRARASQRDSNTLNYNHLNRARHSSGRCQSIRSALEGQFAGASVHLG